MEAVLQDNQFTDFGEDVLYPFQRTGLSRLEGETPESLRSQVRQFAPRQPGVYGMLDVLGRLIYVGKSKLLRNRLLSYFLPNNEEDKAGRIVQSTSGIVWETQPSEFAALLREQYLIRTFQPRYNVQGIPRRQQPIFICLGRQPAEQLYTARRSDPKAVCIGPLFGAARAGRAVEVLNRFFKLRDCSSKQPCSFTEQLQLFDIELRPGCIRLEIESCLGPCISACSRSVYDRQVTLAREFLEGKDERVVLQLEENLRHAAANLHFEQAVVLREDLKAVGWLARRTADLARARENFSFVYPVAGVRSGDAKGSTQDIWYLIRRGVIEGAIAAPKSAEKLARSAKLLERWISEEHQVGTRFLPRSETLALISSWFRNNRSELKRTFLPTQAAIDLGKSPGSHSPAAVKL